MSDYIKIKYDQDKSWGIATSIDLHSCKPEFIRDEAKIREFVNQLCDLMKVKKFGECTVVNFGEREEIEGFSMVQLIETSLISGHFANKTNNAYIDIFSCRFHDPQVVADFAKKFFQAKDYTLNFLFRK